MALSTDTIVAVASAPGAGERAILRLSGAATFDLVARAFRSGADEPRRTQRGLFTGRFEDGVESVPCLLLWMPGPRSFTREDVAELHVPGAPPLVTAGLRRLVELGARPAQPGEFTRRAFENGRIDLTRAEGVLAMVEATGESELRAAHRLLSGGLAAKVDAVREQLVALRALCEASLDFDESETGHVDPAEIDRRAGAIEAALSEALSGEAGRPAARGLPRVVLRGAPNAGKSALFRRLCPTSRALVSDVPGTTRDTLTGEWRAAGLACELIDTAGVEELAADAGAPAREAQRRAREMEHGADLVLWVVDAARADPAADLEALERLPAGTSVVAVWNQVDRERARPAPEGFTARAAALVETSAVTGQGVEELGAAAAGLLRAARAQGAGRELGERHRRGLARSLEELRDARRAQAAGVSTDLLAEGLRRATDALDGVTGRTTPEQVLDDLFARFCIGK